MPSDQLILHLPFASLYLPPTFHFRQAYSSFLIETVSFTLNPSIQQHRSDIGMSSSSTPSLLSEYPSRRVRRNPSMLALNQHSRNALSRMLKHRTYKEELQAYYERQSEGLPFIPNYLVNTVYAQLVKQQWLIYTKICSPNKLVAKSTHAESAVSTPSPSPSPPPPPPLPAARLHRSYTTLDLSQPLQQEDEDMNHVNMIIESLINDGAPSSTMSANLRKTPSAQEFEDLQNLVNADSFKLSLVMQDLRLPSAWDLKAKGENIDISRDHMQLTYRGKRHKLCVCVSTAFVEPTR